MIFEEPSKETPLIVTGEAIFVAVAALPAMLPEIFEPLTPIILASVILASANFAVVTLPSLILVVVIASIAISGKAAVPARSPAN